MKNVVIFQDFVKAKTYGHNWQTEELFNYFRAQIDNSLYWGWKPEDIVICTNLDFEYKNANIVKLDNICQYNKYFNKQYGILELLERKIITENFWFHDFDDWQVGEMVFPNFNGDIGMGKYINAQQWNTGSIFVKPSSVDIWRLIVDFMDENKKHPQVDNKGDENIVNLVYGLYREIQNRFSLLNNQYNVGCTQFEMRYESAIKPIMVAAFKPDEKKNVQKFIDKEIVDKYLLDIFKKHNIGVK
tara:strand:- start:3396 stop:4127 length:732 start_codon:yes stop_codon:yes gene_type:complete